MIEKRLKLSNMAQRVLTGLILIPIVLVFVGVGGVWFAAQIGVISAVAVVEFCRLGSTAAWRGSRWWGVGISTALIVAFSLGTPPTVLLLILAGGFGAVWLSERRRYDSRTRFSRALITLAGLLYVAVPAGILVALRLFAADGMMWVLVILGVSAGTDSFAYFGGRLFGKTPLAPSISPTKTVEGALSGIVVGALIGGLMLALNSGWTVERALVVVAAAPLAILGDLIESAIKRLFRAKDSHLSGFNLFPGHGGVLDRVDAIIVVTVFCYLYIFLSSTNG
jgi:phosphatidate cytidylyltransferase